METLGNIYVDTTKKDVDIRDLCQLIQKSDENLYPGWF